MTFNIASGDAGDTMGNYLSNSSIPAGTYTKFRVTLSRTQTIKGQGSYLGTTYYTTTQNGTVEQGGTTFYKATTDPTKYEGVSFKVPADAECEADEVLEIIGDDMRVTKSFATPLVINEGETQTISLSFNTKEMIGFEAIGGGEFIFYPLPPQESAQ